MKDGKPAFDGSIGGLTWCKRGGLRSASWLLSLMWVAFHPCQTFAGELPEPSTTRPIRVQRNLVIREIDGLPIKADVYRPDNDELYPLVFMIHGGAWSTGDKWNLSDHARQMAQAGFVAVAINYRLAPSHPYPAQLEDCQYALKWAVQRARVWKADAERVGLWGYSAGAQLAAMLAVQPLEDQPEIQAVVAGGAPCEFSFIPEDNRVLASVMGGAPREIPEVYKAASPAEFVCETLCPFFFFHGTADLLVPISSSQIMYRKMKRLGCVAEYFTVEGQGHLLTFLNSTARKKAIAFLKQHLREVSPPRTQCQ